MDGDTPEPTASKDVTTGAFDPPAPDRERLAVLDAPPERVGLLLAEARTRRGLRLDDVSERLGNRLDATELMALESGVLRVAPEDLAALTTLYGVEPGDLVPPRDHLVIDLCEGYLRAGPDIALLTDGVGRTEVLRRYLEMVWEMRSVEPGTMVPLRDDDLAALQVQLGADGERIERELRALMDAPRPDRGPRRRVLVGLGAALALVTGGVLMWQNGDGPTPQGEPTAVTAAVAGATQDLSSLPPAPSAQIGDAATLERGTTDTPPVTDLEGLPPAPGAEIGDAAVLERNPDGSAGTQTTR